jgi:uncharacterized iron-regulated protein
MCLKNIIVIHLILLFPLMAFSDEEKILQLRIGDPDLGGKSMAVTPGKIYSCKVGKPITFSKMIEEMDKSRFIYLGESHNSFPMHQIQAKIVQALYEQNRDLALGLEMFPFTSQEALRMWSLGILTEEEFVREAKWYVNWNFHFGFYKDIFRLAKDFSIPVYALNIPRYLIKKIRMSGWDSLTEKEKKMVPQPDLSHQDHRLLVRTIFESTHLPPQMKGKGLEMAFEGLYRAQSAWDEAMAYYAVKAAEKEKRKMVVLAGSGHLLYNLGINRRVYERMQKPFKTVICVIVPEDKEKVEVSRSAAHYIWGLPEEERPAYPSVGLSVRTFDGLENLVIDRDPIDGAAKGQDFKKGDVILSVDGKSFADINEMRIYLSRFTWDDKVKFRLLREAKEKEVFLKLKETEADSSSGK